MSKTRPSPTYAGVDICKDALDVSIAGRSRERYDNHAAGIAGLIKSLRKIPGPVHVICEPSGGYERDLLEAFWSAGIPVSLVNAARVRSFARAQGPFHQGVGGHGRPPLRLGKSAFQSAVRIR